ncbi:hypothetical protein A8H40_08995 [Burkholderia multivorans]|jgi:hypothetical protein|nr:hypothetical protein A8H40_08995 [Burkholderia multivorans]PRD82071.1 hypothetical protein C6P74_05150 [Burkholderia multivorans]PRE27158.1 hypothetical protein C6P79_15100 [Burkholderia multivorans]PRE83237.1 hypothetical protein C6Q02_16570 [Burkholderia multivorans]PRF16398.1 hypothetical protein C6Q01_01080 [Burkholderia multivorans]
MAGKGVVLLVLVRHLSALLFPVMGRRRAIAARGNFLVNSSSNWNSIQQSKTISRNRGIHPVGRGHAS